MEQHWMPSRTFQDGVEWRCLASWREHMKDRLVVCTSCSSTNRLPSTRPALAAKCGRCGARLFDGIPGDVTGTNLTAQVARSGIPVLVDVWAPWCGPCRMMAPAYEAAARTLEPDIRVVKVNSEAEQAAAARLGIRSIPTMVLFDSGREVARVSGAMTTSDRIVEWVRTQLPS